MFSGLESLPCLEHIYNLYWNLNLCHLMNSILISFTVFYIPRNMACMVLRSLTTLSQLIELWTSKNKKNTQQSRCPQRLLGHTLPHNRWLLFTVDLQEQQREIAIHYKSLTSAEPNWCHELSSWNGDGAARVLYVMGNSWNANTAYVYGNSKNRNTPKS